MTAEGGDGEAKLAALVRGACAGSIVSVVPLRAGLGTRRFLRLQTDGRPATLIARIDAPEDPAGRPPGIAPEPPVEPLRALMEHAGLPVPRRFGGDASIELLEDFGDRTLADAEDRRGAYRQACALVPRIQRLESAPGVAAFERRLDATLFTYKARLFSDWSLPTALGRAATAPEAQAVHEAFAWIADHLDPAAGTPARLAHRDFQSANLMLRSDGSLGMIDLQGAFLAPPEYDLVCLLRDSYVELDDDEIRGHLEAVRPALPDAPAPDDFARRFDLLTLTRKGKDHARFVSLAARRGERDLLDHVPTTVRALHGAAARCADLDPCLARLAELVLRLPETPGDPPCAP